MQRRGRKVKPDTEIVVFRGVRYTRRPGKRYFKTMVKGGDGEWRPESLHRAIYKHHYGDIPDGHHVHHKDGDWNNNSVDNLECLTRQDHVRRHPDWGKSDHQLADLDKARRIQWRHKPYKSYTCEWCRSEFESRWGRVPRFCSVGCCRKAYARRAGL